MLDEHRPVDIVAWKADGSFIALDGAIPMNYNYRAGTRNYKCPASGQIRKIRDVCIFKINGLEVYL